MSLPPLLLHYYITLRCNCQCTFCDIWKISAKKSDDAHLDDVAKNLRDARNLGVRFVDFTGGEPLLHDELPAMLRYAKELGYKTTVTTNCVRYVRDSEKLAGLIDFLHFSLDALNAKKHDAIRGQNSFKHVMRSLDRARELGETPDLLFTVSSANVDHLKPMTKFAQALGLMLVVNPVFAYSSVAQPDIEFLQTIERYAAAPFVYVNTAFHRLRRQGGNQINAPRCRVMVSTIVISPDNKVVLPCYHFQQEKMNIKKANPSLQDMGSLTPPASRDKKVIARNGVTKRSPAKHPSLMQGIAALTPFARNDLWVLRHSLTWRYYQKKQGRFYFCQGCHLNCYFDPSFLYKVDRYFWLSALAKSRYWWDKNIRKKVMKIDDRLAAEIAAEIMEKYDNI